MAKGKERSSATRQTEEGILRVPAPTQMPRTTKKGRQSTRRQVEQTNGTSQEQVMSPRPTKGGTEKEWMTRQSTGIGLNKTQTPLVEAGLSRLDRPRLRAKKARPDGTRREGISSWMWESSGCDFGSDLARTSIVISLVISLVVSL